MDPRHPDSVPGPVDPLEIRRDSLLARMERVRPKVVALIAPAGFGKTTLARQFVASGSAWAVCDCSGLRDDLDLARRLIPALAAENPEREQNLTQRELMLGDGGTSMAERVNIALEAWRQPAVGTFVFENAEHLANCAPAREFFSRLLARRPEGRTIVICSREGLRIHLTRFAAPHEIMVLRAQDLAFDANDVRAIFAPYIDDAPSIDRILAVSQGWPIAVLLLKRFATEGRIGKLLDRLDDVAFEELHDYLADEVLATLDPRLTEAVFALACIPRASATDVRVAFADSRTVEEIAEFAKESPFLTRNDDGSFTVHPLLASLLVEHQEDRRDELLRRVAMRYEEQREFQRAAELHLAHGDQPAAARALGQHEVVRDHTPSMQYARVLSSFDHALVQRFPRLWGVTALLRMFCVDTESLLDEAESIWRTLPPEVSPIERYYIFVFRVIFMSYLGLFEEALSMLETFGRSAQVNDQPKNLLDGYVLYLRGLLRARMGRFTGAERDFTVSLPIIEEMDVMASGTYLTLGADIARVRGERAVERQLLERAIERAQASGLSNFVAFDLAEALFGAWFAGEGALAATYAVQLEETVERFGVCGFAYLAASARGRSAEPNERDIPKYVAFGRLIAAAHTSDEREAARLTRSALVVAQQYHAPFVEAIAAAAVAVCDELAFDEHVAIARAAAARCESQPLQDAIEALALRKKQLGILGPLVAHLSHERAKRVAPLELEIATGRVLVDGALIALSGRELELLVAIGLRREATPRARLATMLWPDLEEYPARNALSVCLHRLRQHLGREDAVLREDDGYRLHGEAVVDLWEIDRASSLLRAREQLGDGDRAALRRAWTRLRDDRPSRMQRWEWFEPTERRLGELRIEVAQRLANDALASGDAHGALAFASDMIDYDPCDEAAREIAIRAHLLLGDRAAAMRQYRQYRDTLQAELQCEPSPSLSSLVLA